MDISRVRVLGLSLDQRDHGQDDGRQGCVVPEEPLDLGCRHLARQPAALLLSLPDNHRTRRGLVFLVLGGHGNDVVPVCGQDGVDLVGVGLLITPTLNSDPPPTTCDSANLLKTTGHEFSNTAPFHCLTRFPTSPFVRPILKKFHFFSLITALASTAFLMSTAWFEKI